ncbi:MAG: ribonuclease P protein component [Deltaproteobacteria bacterium]|nr:ribonuclease P protein component [Deltaproteobacteria bacterium]
MNRKDFVNLNRFGARRYTSSFTIILLKNGLGITRLGITVAKRTGNAVKRNRIKRLIREFYRQNKACFPRGCDVVVAARKNAVDLDYRRVKEELGALFADKKDIIQP